jgi:hypothetical protein
MEHKLHSWDVLDPVALKPAGAISDAFIQVGALDYRAAARFVSRVPYGRNTTAVDPLIVIRERRGTCSTKHALLHRLATEQNVDVALVIGIYEMHQRNTPGVGPILRKYGLVAVPEAHCYLRFRGDRIDVTREIDADPPEAIAQFLHEEDIAPEQIGDYKTTLHQQFLQRWIAETGAADGRGLDEMWRIREECIAVLSRERSCVVAVTSSA